MAEGFATTNSLDIYRSAQALIREHGEVAAREAALRADAMLEKGDVKGCDVWKRIPRSAEELQRENPRDGERRH